MGPGSYGGVGATIGAAAMAILVALGVLAIVSFGGGVNQPLTARPAVAMNAPPPGQG